MSRPAIESGAEQLRPLDLGEATRLVRMSGNFLAGIINNRTVAEEDRVQALRVKIGIEKFQTESAATYMIWAEPSVAQARNAERNSQHLKTAKALLCEAEIVATTYPELATEDLGYQGLPFVGELATFDLGRVVELPTVS